MKMEINEKKVNPLLKRTEVRFTLNHAGEPTPTKGAVVDELVNQLKAKKDAVVLEKVESSYGIGVSKGYAKIYESKEAALEIEKDHMLARNGIQKPEYKPADAPAEE